MRHPPGPSGPYDLPVRVGVAHRVVAEVSLDREGLEWLAGLCPHGDGFTDDLWRALDRVLEIERIHEELEPGLEVVFVEGAP